MGLLSGFRDGLIFASGMFFRHQGAYSGVAQRPVVCDKCHSDSGCFHAHGRYKRSLTTLRNWVLTSVAIWKHRWLCLRCERTMSTGPADVIAHIPICTMLIVTLLWTYLQGQRGIHNSIPQSLDGAAEPRTLARYLKRAKAACLETQQAIREVLIEIKEPRPWDETFAQGLSPPQKLLNRHREPSAVAILWRALAMLLIGSETLSIAPCLLMARARTKAQQRGSRFLV